MISHDMEAALTYASHILHIGKLPFFGTKEAYLASDIGKVFVPGRKEGVGIKLYAGASGNTDDVVEAFLNGTLNAVGEANCDDHDHEHGEGHTCGHGGCHH